jgi:hypothetical protein
MTQAYMSAQIVLRFRLGSCNLIVFLSLRGNVTWIRHILYHFGYNVFWRYTHREDVYSTGSYVNEIISYVTFPFLHVLHSSVGTIITVGISQVDRFNIKVIVLFHLKIHSDILLLL